MESYFNVDLDFLLPICGIIAKASKNVSMERQYKNSLTDVHEEHDISQR